MDKDKFETQSGGHIKEGHQESDVSVQAIVWSGVILAAGGVLAFVLMIWHDPIHGKVGERP